MKRKLSFMLIQREGCGLYSTRISGSSSSAVTRADAMASFSSLPNFIHLIWNSKLMEINGPIEANAALNPLIQHEPKRSLLFQIISGHALCRETAADDDFCFTNLSSYSFKTNGQDDKE